MSGVVKRRVLAAMSGGVDSSVAAALMTERGDEVIGVTMKMWSGPNGEAPTAGCCTVSDAEDARRVASQLDIPYYVLDYTEDFSEGVIEHFVDDYRHGRTPNPCVECNRSVKFDRLLASARELGCDLVVTGHYARTELTNDGWRLYRGGDIDKDQSYVLSMLGQDELQMARFPVGHLEKSETRRIAADLRLRTANKPESMDICFVGKRDYRVFLRGVAPDVFTPGQIVDINGTSLGRHEGIAGFTIGQRRGLGVSVGEPRYVSDIDPNTATVTLGRRSDLTSLAVDVEMMTTVSGSPVEGSVLAQYRAHGEAVSAVVSGTSVLFDEPQEAVATGQTITFYQHDEVLGGAKIARRR